MKYNCTVQSVPVSCVDCKRTYTMRLSGVRNLCRLLVFQERADIGGGAEEIIAIFEALIGEDGATHDDMVFLFMSKDIDREEICWEASAAKDIHPGVAELILGVRGRNGVLLAAHPALGVECYCFALPPYTRQGIIKAFDAPARRSWLYSHMYELGQFLQNSKPRQLVLSR